MRKSGVKALGLTGECHRILRVLSSGGESGTLGGAVKCVDIKRNAGGESDALGLFEIPDAIRREWDLF